MVAQGIDPAIVVDCSHANSQKDYRRQHIVVQAVCQQLPTQTALRGVMIESHLQPGNQPLQSGKPLTYGQSITDGCIGWDDSEAVLEELAEAVQQKRG